MKKAIALAALVLAGIAAAPAAADTEYYANSNTIQLTSTSVGRSWEASSIQVAGQEGPITDVDAVISGIDMKRLYQLNLMLVSPSGESEVLTSNNCDDKNVTNRSFTFDQQDGNAMPAWTHGYCDRSSYMPTYRPYAGDPMFKGLPGVGPAPWSGNFDNFDNENANGRWTLYAVKYCYYEDSCSTTDEVGAWRLKITTADDTIIDVPGGSGSVGVGSPFPDTQTVTGASGVIDELSVHLDGIYHSHPEDIDMMLEGPTGQTVMLMSDSCGSYPMNAYGFEWFDNAPAKMPYGGTTDVCNQTNQRPTDNQPGDSLPPPAPQAPYGPNLSDFIGTSPNGTWKLWVRDDALGDEGFINQKFQLHYKLRQPTTVRFREPEITVHEGEDGLLTLDRSELPHMGLGRVHLAVTDLTAGPDDHGPVTDTLEFQRGGTTAGAGFTVPIDGETEGDEQFEVSLTSTEGDLQIAEPSTAIVTIAKNGGFGHRARVRLGLAKKRIPASGPVPVRVKNRNGFAVTGGLSARTPKGVKLASRKLAVPAHGRRTVRLKLPEALQEKLRRAGKLKLRLKAVVRDPIDGVRTVRKAVTARLLPGTAARR